ncbi:MAG TPA: coenzyme F420-0:L-glutamate ligase, partial [Methanomicrobiales archaeon]|nr:coenzyme F420-0:L-glutamate ligase [Methanomicrobiales archaeon]
MVGKARMTMVLSTAPMRVPSMRIPRTIFWLPFIRPEGCPFPPDVAVGWLRARRTGGPGSSAAGPTPSPLFPSTRYPPSMTIQVIPVEGLPLIRKGDDIPALVSERVALRDGDILVLASTIYSKAKGHTRRLSDI